MGGGKAPDTSASDAAAAKAEERAAKAEASADKAEAKANKQLSSTARASYGRRTGRRVLLAEGKEDKVGSLSGGGSGNSGTNI